jgi:hypothetical protein
MSHLSDLFAKTSQLIYGVTSQSAAAERAQTARACEQPFEQRVGQLCVRLLYDVLVNRQTFSARVEHEKEKFSR